MKLDAKKLNMFAWAISLIVSTAAMVAWGQLYQWWLGDLSAYQWFPLFGLLAFSLMWAHYIVAAVRLYGGLDRQTTKTYFEITSAIVLVFLILHPVVLSWQLMQDGLGLPPVSFLEYGGRSLMLPIVIGETALLIFVAYELRRWLRRRQWRNYVQYLSDAAMIGIFYHGLSLGSHLSSGWYKYLWWFYGASLVAALIYMYRSKIMPQKG